MPWRFDLGSSRAMVFYSKGEKAYGVLVGQYRPWMIIINRIIKFYLPCCLLSSVFWFKFDPNLPNRSLCRQGYKLLESQLAARIVPYCDLTIIGSTDALTRC